ncbi:MAG: hypothetical protein HY446_00890 [Candidatus Niyogibacteria bacterium]|nr:hypothetical protein [Candidatus Niyogibacteria bacterium]
MLAEKWHRVKAWIWENESDLVVALSFMLIAVVGFGLGRLSVLKQTGPSLEIQKFAAPALESANQTAGALLGSKNGTAYHLPSCPGALKIKEENKIWFSSREEAEKLGYKPASNCPGL